MLVIILLYIFQKSLQNRGVMAYQMNVYVRGVSASPTRAARAG